MKKVSIMLIVFLTGCLKVNSYIKPDVDFSKIKKIAVVKLNSQIATDLTKLALIKRGFDVIEKEKLSESEKQTLHNEGIDAILYVSAEESREVFIRDAVEIALSLSMFDSRSGKLLWNGNIIGLDLDELNEAIRKMVDTIP